ncbi:MAG: hypothetical protein H7X75_08600 [Burkholderiaceae bacterium]|nr:hypothetical protein [Burkholderiaceae bacterium]
MRTTPSRFNSFIGSIDPSFEGRPVPGRSPAVAAGEQSGPSSELSILERRHPAVIQTLRLLWGYPELNQYFEKVNCGGDASLNFAPDAMAELMVLASLHQRICPQRPTTPAADVYGGGRWADTWKAARPRR